MAIGQIIVLEAGIATLIVIMLAGN